MLAQNKTIALGKRATETRLPKKNKLKKQNKTEAWTLLGDVSKDKDGPWDAKKSQEFTNPTSVNSGEKLGPELYGRGQQIVLRESEWFVKRTTKNKFATTTTYLARRRGTAVARHNLECHTSSSFSLQFFKKTLTLLSDDNDNDVGPLSIIYFKIKIYSKCQQNVKKLRCLTNIFCKLSTDWLATLTLLISRISSPTWSVAVVAGTNETRYK